jgi:anti-sigma-K factor RskA
MKRCEELRDQLLPGYALGALEAEEQGEAQAHVDDCPECREEVEQIAEALHTTLGQSVPPVSPSPLVRTQFLARLALEMSPDQARGVGTPHAATVPPLMIQAPRSGGAAVSYRPPFPRWLLGASALPAVAAVVLGIALFNMNRQLDDQRNHALYTAFVTPHQTMPLQGPALGHGMTGEVIVPTNGTSGLVIVSGIPRDTNGMTFTCWLHRDGHWAASGKLQPDSSGIAMVVLDRDMNLHHADRLAISMEHAGQLPAAPSQQVLSVAL